ncbi:MAG: CehA/McbA family metallohydrolase, partial [Nocardioidaceae bacterium]
HHADLSRRAFLRTTGAAAGLVTASAPLTFTPAAAGQSRTLTFSGRFTAGTAPDWHYVPVDVPSGVREIAVAYSYNRPPPELPGGLSGNVLDIGIFDPSGHDLGNAEGFRGWSGGARSSFSISTSSATPGYLAGPVSRGRWHIQLGPYSVAPEGLDWQMTVTLTFGPAGPAFEPAPAARSVPGTGRDWYRGDLHLHTVYSDGRRTMPELLQASRAAGLDFIASTEHNNQSAGLEWGRHTPADFLVVHGEEVTTRGGHWLAIGTPAGTWVDWRYRAQDGRFPEFARQVHDLGGLAIVAHPFTPFSGTSWTFGYEHVDAVEIWNGPWTLDDQFAVEHWHQMLVAGDYVPAVGSSDSHRDGQVVGLPHTVVLAESLATGSLLDGIRAGRAWVAESRAVDLDLTVTGPSGAATCGGRVDAAPTDTVTVRLAVSGVPGCTATVRGASGVVAAGAADAEGRIALTRDLPASASPFLRAEVRRPSPDVPADPTTGSPGGPMVALTNPVFVGYSPAP